MTKVTIKEIAKILNVSTATVSRVLNHSGGYSEETKKRVWDVLEKYNYQTNVAAKSLRTNKTNSVGIVLPDLTNEYFAKIAVAIERVLMKKGFSINIYNMSEDANKEQLILQDLQSRGVDGLIYVSGYRDLVNNVRALHFPVVCVNQLDKMDRDVPIVETDHRTGGYLAAKALLDRGAKKIVMLRDERDILPVHQREEGFVQALKEFGYSKNNTLIRRVPFDVTLAKEAISDLMTHQVSFDGIFASSDTLAIGALKALQLNGKDIPRDVQVVGFDNVTFSQYSSPALTTIHQSTDELGEQASELLLRLMSEQKLGHAEQIVVPVHLVERDTTR